MSAGFAQTKQVFEGRDAEGDARFDGRGHEEASSARCEAPTQGERFEGRGHAEASSARFEGPRQGSGERFDGRGREEVSKIARLRERGRREESGAAFEDRGAQDPEEGRGRRSGTARRDEPGPGVSDTDSSDCPGHHLPCSEKHFKRHCATI